MPAYAPDYDLESAIEQICSDSESWEDDDDDEEMATWYPEEYVILCNGFRGSGKSVYVAWFGGMYLENTDHKVFSNLTYKVPYLKECGFDNLPLNLEWEKMISFNADLPTGSLHQVDEVDTYLDKLRTNTNQNLLATKFLEQLRKRSLKFIFSCQFGNYLPYGTLDQVDMMINAQDLFFSPAGREAGFGKGERFLYSIRDKSGLFTGGRKHPWFVSLDGQKIWPFFESGQLHDPTQFAKKYEIDAGKVDQGNGETYYSGEEGARKQETELRKYRGTVSMIWGSALMTFIQENPEHVNMNDQGNKITVSMNQIEAGIAKMKSKGKGEVLSSYRSLLQMADSGSEVLRRRKGNIIEIMKPQAFALQDENGNYEEVVEQEHSLGFERLE